MAAGFSLTCMTGNWRRLGRMGSLSNIALLFDVDGVLTDEHARVDVLVVRAILDLAVRDARVAFITGRSRAWLEDSLMPVMRSLGGEPYSPAFRFAAEMGALRFGQSTGYTWRVSEEHAVPEAVRERLSLLPVVHNIEDLIEWDGSKAATATLESLHRPELPGHAGKGPRYARIAPP